MLEAPAYSPVSPNHTGMSAQGWICCVFKKAAGTHSACGGGLGLTKASAALILDETKSPIVNMPGGEAALKVPTV